MDEQLHILDIDNLELLNQSTQAQALTALETGKVIYFPNYSFELECQEKEHLLSEKILDKHHKNTSFDYRLQRLGSYNRKATNPELPQTLQNFMLRYAEFAKTLVDSAIPQYKDALRWGRTSYRPAEIKGRASSKRKDDTRLHVDSFPASPVYGQRILRVFCNVNPYGEPRVWHLGEPFNRVMERFSPRIPDYNLFRAKFLKLVKSTKTLRSAYDHYQIHLHDKMKLDDHYQQTVNKQRFDFQAQSSWMVFTDQVSHAALGGQYLLEQTFYLPIEAMSEPELSPFKHWEKERSIG